MKEHEIAEWLLIADEDVVSASILDRENNLSNSYYFCSQAVEKYLKSYLFANDIKINKNHNISQTLWNCINHNKDFVEIQPDCNKMTQAVKKIRYPGRMIPTKEDIKKAFNLIEKTRKLKPIQNLYKNIIDKYGDDWKNTLFKKVTNVEVNISAEEIAKL